MILIRVFIREIRKPWKEISNGPFPITPEQLTEARDRFAQELAKSDPLGGARQAPQTTARAILGEVAPHLSSFDRMMLGFAVTSDRCYYEIENP